MKIIGLSTGETPARHFGLSLFDELPVSGIRRKEVEAIRKEFPQASIVV